MPAVKLAHLPKVSQLASTSPSRVAVSRERSSYAEVMSSLRTTGSASPLIERIRVAQASAPDQRGAREGPFTATG